MRLEQSRIDYQFHVSIYHLRCSHVEIHFHQIRCAMSWDPGLLRKYSATGHFRLLNQLRGDLKKRPLDRDQSTGLLRMPGSGRSQRSPRRVEPVRVASQEPPSTFSQQDQVPLVELPPLTEEQPKSFRDRLNAIEMR